MSLGTILVPTDLSAASAPSLRLAGSIARRAGASIMLLHVDPHVDVESIERAMQELALELPDDIPRSTLIVQERTVEGILAVARDLRADLVVMGGHGRSAMHFMLGSVAARILRLAPCPVLVRRLGIEGQGGSGAFLRVLVAVDYSPFSQVAAMFAAQLVGPGGSFELVHVCDGSLADRPEALSAFSAELQLEQTCELYIADGNVANAIIDRSSEIGADLIVVGAHSRQHFASRLLGRTADRLLRRAPCPVMVIPDTALHHERRLPDCSQISR